MARLSRGETLDPCGTGDIAELLIICLGESFLNESRFDACVVSEGMRSSSSLMPFGNGDLSHKLRRAGLLAGGDFWLTDLGLPSDLTKGNDTSLEKSVWTEIGDSSFDFF